MEQETSIRDNLGIDEIILYTHTDYRFVWKYAITRMRKYFPRTKINFLIDYLGGMKVYNFGEYIFKINNIGWLQYDDKSKYTRRVHTCLSQDSEKVILFMHEDMFLFGEPDYVKLKEFATLVREDKADVIKLIRGSEQLIPSNLHPNLFKNPDNLKFAIQPSIIKEKTLWLVMFSTPGDTIWEFEANSFVTPVLKNTFFCYNGESKRGLHHYNNSIYPYFATAIVKGKWNTEEYSKELEELFKEIS